MRLWVLALMLCLVLNVVAEARDDKEWSRLENQKQTIFEWAKMSFCSGQLREIDSLSGSIKSDEYFSNETRKSFISERNFSKREELQRLLAKEEAMILAQKHQLFETVNLYKVAECNMGEAIFKLYCPEGYSKNCEQMKSSYSDIIKKQISTYSAP